MTVSDREHGLVGVSTGLASGRVTVGLTSGARLVFDGWGTPVDRAGELARAGTIGQVLVDSSTASRLPDEFTDGASPGGGILDLSAHVTGSHVP